MRRNRRRFYLSSSALLIVLAVVLTIAITAAFLLFLAADKRKEQERAERVKQIMQERDEQKKQDDPQKKIFVEESGVVVSNPLLEATDLERNSEIGSVLFSTKDFIKNAKWPELSKDDIISVQWKGLALEFTQNQIGVLQFTAYTRGDPGYSEMSVSIGSLNVILSVTSVPTTYYIPFSGLPAVPLISIERISENGEIHLENMQLAAYNDEVPVEYLARGYYTNADIPTEILLKENAVGGDSRQTIVKGDVLFNLSNNVLTAYLMNGDNVEKLGSVSPLGTTRDMALSEDGNYIYVTARQCGVYVVDIRDPKELKIASHFDTLEATTGLYVDGKYVFLCDRYYGVTIVDASDPTALKYVSNVGAQSEYQDCSVHNGYMFVGVYSQKRVDIYNLAEITNPELVSQISLDGAGQGTAVQGNTLFVSTGLNSSRNEYKPEYQFGSGTGNGMEIYDISDITDPKRISIVKADGSMNFAGKDVWDIVVSGKYAYLSSMSNGVYIYDISDLSNPVCVQRYRMVNEVPTEEAGDAQIQEITDAVSVEWASFWHCNVLDGELVLSTPDAGFVRVKLDYAQKPMEETPGQYQTVEKNR